MAFDIKRFDIYRKVPSDLATPTKTGGVMTFICVAVIGFLIVAETVNYFRVELVSEMYVFSPNFYSDKIPVQMAVEFPHLECKYLDLDIIDDLGRRQEALIEAKYKTPLGDHDEGCFFQGKLKISKTKGSIRIFMDFSGGHPPANDLRHVIHYVLVGHPASHIKYKNIRGSFNPLYGANHSEPREASVKAHDYVMRIVPTIVHHSNGMALHSYQYTYGYRAHTEAESVAYVGFFYDLVPLTVSYKEKSKPLYHFITMLCATVGGTFTVASLVDSVLLGAAGTVKKIQQSRSS